MVRVDSEKCDQCGTCVSVCPVAALHLIDMLSVDYKICTECGNCIKVCAFAALSYSDTSSELSDAFNNCNSAG